MMQAVDFNSQAELNTTATSALQVAMVVDADGREIPITEEMIMRACDELMSQWCFPRRAA